jgi:hypothetical protein
MGTRIVAMRAKETAKEEADSPEGNDRKKGKGNCNDTGAYWVWLRG